MRIGYGWPEDNDDKEAGDEKQEDGELDAEGWPIGMGPHPFPTPRWYDDRPVLTQALLEALPDVPRDVVSIVVAYTDLGPIRLTPMVQPVEDHCWSDDDHAALKQLLPEHYAKGPAAMRSLFLSHQNRRRGIRWIPLPYLIPSVTNETFLVRDRGLPNGGVVFDWMWSPQLMSLIGHEMSGYDVTSRWSKMALVTRAWGHSLDHIGVVQTPERPVGLLPVLAQVDSPQKKKRHRRRRRKNAYNRRRSD
jgi:hypothetical protein